MNVVRMILLRLVLILAAVQMVYSQQQHPNSPVLKSYVPSDKHSLVTPNDLTYELWQEFLLVKKANEGDPVAQHELGIRYISGKTFVADTQKAAYWIARAAAQGLPSARYNLGILQHNGWAVPWNPFEAFRNFEFAASRGMPEAEYALGIFYLDNLVVPRDEMEAVCLVTAAADSEYLPARETLMKFQEHGIGKRKAKGTSEGRPPQTPGGRVMFLDFDRDTSTHVPDSTLVGELVRDGSGKVRALSDSTDTVVDTLPLVPLIRQAAEAGSPEALTLLGRWYEKGTYVHKDVIAASMYYLRATRFDSPRAPLLLWNLTHEPRYFDLLKERVDRHDAAAETVWPALIALQFDNQMTAQQAIGLIESAVRKENVAALIELGLWYIQGNMVSRDQSHGLELWEQAKARGSREAEIRLAVTDLMSSQDSSKAARLVNFLLDAMRDGSVLAEVGLGYCYEHGFGVEQHTGDAAKLYRKSAERGSLSGYESLKRLYNRLRPPEKEFHIDE
ncbi:MAG TPA: tetratricopeptide repeat protein [Bacteroidota bacterium]|nr:tetratricopeptide repeat protein [Bacteroidota bacterium]